MGYILGLGKGSKTVLGSTHVVEDFVVGDLVMGDYVIICFESRGFCHGGFCPSQIWDS